MRVTNHQIYETVIANLTRHRETFDRANEKVVSGKRINRPSDDPRGAAEIAAYRDRLASLNQYGKNVDHLSGNLKMVDITLETASDLLAEARGIALAASNGWDTVSGMDNLADQVGELKKEIVALANARMGEQYLFGGYDSATPPFDSIGNYQGDSGVTEVRIDEDTTVTANFPGDSVFGAAGGGVDIFQILTNLENDLRTSNLAGIQGAVSALKDATTQIEDVRAVNAFRAVRLDNASRRQEKLETDALEQVSRIEDVDMAEAIIKMQRQELTLQVVMQSSAKILEMNLLNFLD
jgi:flagellar hook-associated protein 3 FlgL